MVKKMERMSVEDVILTLSQTISISVEAGLAVNAKEILEVS